MTLTVTVFEFARRTGYLVHRQSNCLLNMLAYFVCPTLSVAADIIWSNLTRKTCCCAENDSFRIRGHYSLRSTRAHTIASEFHACVKFNLVVNYSLSVFSVQLILFLRQSLCMCIVLWSKSNKKTSTSIYRRKQHIRNSNHLKSLGTQNAVWAKWRQHYSTYGRKCLLPSIW